MQVDDGQRVEAELQERLRQVERELPLPTGLAQRRFRLPSDHREKASVLLRLGQAGQCGQIDQLGPVGRIDGGAVCGGLVGCGLAHH